MISRFGCALGLIAAVGAARAAAQQADSSLLTLARIYASHEFDTQGFGPARWVDGGAGYTTLEPAADGRGAEIVRYDTERGTRAVLVPAARLVPPGAPAPIEVEDYAWSPDQKRVLVFTNTQRVWRLNTRGDYWVLDLPTGRLRKLGGPDAKPSTLMFAKFSPDGGRVGYVRENNLYVEDLATGAVTPLTTDGSRTLINGTFDWVYEEELMNFYADGWRWSPDGRSIAYWQLNADSVRDFLLIDNVDSLYSFTVPVQYPKAGRSNSAARVGVVSAAGGPTTWVRLEGDPRNHYIARMDWAAGNDQLALQRLNRLQNTDEVLLADVRTGSPRPVLVERDSAWVDVVNGMTWLDGGKSFTWVSERDGWRHVYQVSRDGGSVRLLTPGSFDVDSVSAVDEKHGWLYYIASPENPAQRYLFRARLDGRGAPERLSPATQPGTHQYDISPDRRYALHTWSRMDTPPVVDIVRLPSHRTVRTLVDNAALRSRLSRLRHGKLEFRTLDLPDGARTPAWIMAPAGLDSTRRYPLVMYVYGGPGTQTVLDRWLGVPHYLFHLYLTQQGFGVASVDNRGTPAPLGRAWRKAIYRRLGVLEADEQAAAARALGRLPWVDSTRIGIWGWSNGGFLSLNGIFRYPGVYRSAVAVAPVTQWALYDNVYTERYNGLPDENRAGYLEGSPLTHAAGLAGDLLVIHGSGDDNVHFQNTELLINALVAANKPFSMMEYPNRTHALRGGLTRLHLFETIARFFGERLAGEPPRASETRALH
ncbi:MAG TPA: S9 family peptidase [Gemmatimonadales bacterium]|nr:S9 family peptidase [Gemmatimonadales bacterium]